MGGGRGYHRPLYHKMQDDLEISNKSFGTKINLYQSDEMAKV